MLTHKRTLAGVIFINISMAENLPFNVYLKSLLPYLPRICKYPLDHHSICVTDCLKLERNRNIQKLISITNKEYKHNGIVNHIDCIYNITYLNKIIYTVQKFY